MKQYYFIFLLVLLCTLLPSTVYSQSLKPFSSDGCSLFPEGTPKQQKLWLNCCVEHDIAYWKGGTYLERLAADQALERCVAQVGEPGIAKLMLAGVRVGGTPYLPTKFRWGYGWSFGRGYDALTETEMLQVNSMLKH
ncbi:MAG: hypothetical protein HWE27_12365 [Gammaproteobacteria bacterium]|nr:hypothetical protein [Gammaproteobacteria bacterium]